MTDNPFPWVVLPAYAVLAAAPWINRWLERPPRPRPGRPEPPTTHETPVQVRIIRRGPGRELDRRRP